MSTVVKPAGKLMGEGGGGHRFVRRLFAIFSPQNTESNDVLVSLQPCTPCRRYDHCGRTYREADLMLTEAEMLPCFSRGVKVHGWPHGLLPSLAPGLPPSLHLVCTPVCTLVCTLVCTPSLHLAIL